LLKAKIRLKFHRTQVINENPKITAKQLQETTGLSRRGVEYNLDKLRKEGKLKRTGSTKSGSRKIIK
jgi:ATP-dependent DNA helicase RecG